MNLKYSNEEISFMVDNALAMKKLSIRECVRRFNEKHAQDIINNTIEPLNKDFLQRLRRNKFEVVSKRVRDICLFLEIDLGTRQSIKLRSSLTDQFMKFEQMLMVHPELEEKITRLLTNVTDVFYVGSQRD
ncbi:hypothetical protein RHO12_01885 [Orbus sturtevantii]|uniref:hypothetical protein n=1 Tax=Orbus sturtevantii TaxID=3074109 RepID=UPI00370D8D53